MASWKSEHVLGSNDALVGMLWLQQAIRSMLVSRDLFVYELNAIRPSKEQQYIAGNERGLRFTFSFLEMPLESYTYLHQMARLEHIRVNYN